MNVACVYTTLFSIGLFSQVLIAKVKDSPTQRVIPASVGESFCLGRFSPDVLWKENMFDAQVDGRVLSSKSGKKILLPDLLVRAKTLAAELGYHGFSAGLCKNGSGWVAAFPAAAGLEKNETSKKYIVKNSDHCLGTLSARSINKKGGVSKVLELNSNELKFSELEPETAVFSVECLPTNKDIEAPQEWYLVPVLGAFAEIPHKEILKEANAEVSIINWINAIRKGEKVGLVSLDVKSSSFAKELENEAVIGHSVQDLIKVRSKMEKNSLKLIGENRVVAKSLVEACRFLWNSPRHRELILDKGANKVGVHSKKVGEDLFVNFLLAHGS